MRVDKREFVSERYQLSYPRQTRKELRESWRARICVHESTFSQLSRPGQTRTRVTWELKRESFLNSHVWVKREQELHEEFSQLSCLDQTRTRVARELMRVENREFVSEFLNSHVLVKR